LIVAAIERTARRERRRPGSILLRVVGCAGLRVVRRIAVLRVLVVVTLLVV
jgi:hypothetical protein